MKRFKTILLMCLSLLVLTACVPGMTSQNHPIRIAGLSTTEGQILSALVQKLIEEETDYPVEMINNLGTSVVSQQAVRNGDADITPARYTGTDMVAVLNETPIKDPNEALAYVQKAFKERFNYKYYDSYGFNNTYTFLVTPEFAAENNLKTVSDLEKISDTVRAGFDSQWLVREGDGYPGFKEEYGFAFDHTNAMQIGLVYNALAGGAMDLVLGYSSDGRIASYDLVMLEDDKQFFPPYDAAPMATQEILDDYPELDGLLKRLEGKISTEQMQELNYEADHLLKEPSVVAEEFLEANNYFRGEDN
ncbi:osmoprotectant ABC transporter substrate-binding protein [Eremococcus coleocola]|uniref:ABC transporter, substrate-binding protein, QAT family n=1 Tax=Eremococcus coleocola ACS-139-V-Col8 TaxID=908337 RepID=E4KNU5_9LACT|nr:osmoprotectant ABC transporter substrate-binding protein [Eremococcus coleocola]EFR30958.1 ABC transporter, substrate-binding protein, QAT family [Eremococcus coleocola ACS-139-V-Col8]